MKCSCPLFLWHQIYYFLSLYSRQPWTRCIAVGSFDVGHLPGLLSLWSVDTVFVFSRKIQIFLYLIQIIIFELKKLFKRMSDGNVLNTQVIETWKKKKECMWVTWQCAIWQLTLFSFPFRQWRYSRGSGCSVQTQARTCSNKADQLGKMPDQHGWTISKSKPMGYCWLLCLSYVEMGQRSRRGESRGHLIFSPIWTHVFLGKQPTWLFPPYDCVV